MAVGDRVQNPDYNGYSTHEVTDETPAQGLKQAALLVKIVGDDGSTSGPATEAKQDSQITLLGAVTETAPATDTASSGLNGRLQRVAQRITSVIALLAGGLPAALSAGGGVKAGIVDALPAGTNNIGDVDILSLPKSSTANTPEIATGATALAANANRKLWSIQNVGTNPLRVRLGSGASGTVFHFVLKGGTADNDGNGGVITDEYYTGIVSVDGTSPKYTVTELS